MRYRERNHPFLICAAALLVIPGASHAIEEARYSVERSEGEFEIRRYEARVVAETFVEGDRASAGNQAFRILVGYIGGDNRGEQKIAMTAPVDQQRGEAIARVSPVTEQRTGERYRVTFTMPASYTLETLPEPSDPRVRLIEEVPRRFAAIQYSGTWSTSRYDEHEARLRAWLAAESLVPVGAEAIPAVWARYDPPFMPWFLRRNEVLIEIGDAP